MYLLTQSSAILTLTRDHRGSQPGHAHAPMARSGQSSSRGRLWVWWKLSYTAAASMPCPPHGTRPSPPSHRHFGSQTLLPSSGVHPANAEGRRAGRSGGAGEQGVPGMASPGSPDPGPDTIAPGVPWGGCEEAEVGSRQRGVWARCLLCLPGSSGPGRPSTGEGSCSLSPTQHVRSAQHLKPRLF